MYFEEALLQRDKSIQDHIDYITELQQLYSLCSHQKNRIDELERERGKVLELQAKCLSLTEERSELQKGQASNWSKMLEINERNKAIEAEQKKANQLIEELRTLMEEKDKFIVYLKGKLALQPLPLNSVDLLNEFEQVDGNKSAVTQRLRTINNPLVKGVLGETHFFGFCKENWGFYLNDRKLPFPEDHHCETNIICVAMSGNFVAASINSVIIVWGIKSERVKFIFSGHSKGILDLTISPDERHLVGCQEDLLKIWDLQSGGLVRSIVEKLDSQNLKLFIHESLIITVLLSRGKIKIFEFEGKIIKNQLVSKGEMKNAFIDKNQLFVDCGPLDGIKSFQIPNLKQQNVRKIETGFSVLGITNNAIISYNETEGILLIDQERYLVREKRILHIHFKKEESDLDLLLSEAILRVQFK
jgi:hypothetical protein